jgi:para-nitrobenzyl esterase
MARRTFAAAVVALLSLQACMHTPTTPPTLRDTADGPVAGVDDPASGTYSWKGVPFAAPPVGEARWRAPRDPQPWSAPRAATAFAPACVQTGRLYGPGLNNRYDETIGATLGRTLGSEDCLYLNIWQPSAPARAPRPVIVWVHGGSNITGYTADPVYDGAHLARTADAVVVSVPYRLGIFGFLDLAALKTGNAAEDSGNFALLDIVKALQFVQGNIARFGGDPQRVTLMGESAGAVNVYALLASPMVAAAKPALFHRLVAMSGGISSAASLPPGSFAAVLPRSVWAARGQALLTHSLVADRSAADVAAAQAKVASQSAPELARYLRAQSADALLTTVRTRLAPLGMSAANPIPDGHVLPADPIAAIRAGRYVRVPVLAGNARDESKLFPQLLAIKPELGGKSGRLLDDAAVFALAHKYDAEAPPATRIEQWIPPAYLPVDAPVTGFNARVAALDRIWFMAYRDDVLNALRSQQREVWYYRFDWDALPKPFDDIFGAAHTFDLPFVFGNFGPSLYSRIMFTRANEPGRLALSQAMMKSVGAFAQQGDPNNAALPVAWPAWPGRLVFDADARQARIHAE